MSVITSKPLKLPTIAKPITCLAIFLILNFFAIWFNVAPEPTASSINSIFLKTRWSVTANVFFALFIRSLIFDKDFCGIGIIPLIF